MLVTEIAVETFPLIIVANPTWYTDVSIPTLVEAALTLTNPIGGFDTITRALVPVGIPTDNESSRWNLTKVDADDTIVPEI